MDWSRAELSLERFEKVATVQLDILQQQLSKIQGLRHSGQWSASRKEEINSERTLHQLVNVFKQITIFRSELTSNFDRDRFDLRVRPLRTRMQEMLSTLGQTLPTDGETDYSKEEAPLLQLTKDKDELDSLKRRAECAREDAEAHERLAQVIETASAFDYGIFCSVCRMSWKSKA